MVCMVERSPVIVCSNPAPITTYLKVLTFAEAAPVAAPEEAAEAPLEAAAEAPVEAAAEAPVEAAGADFAYYAYYP